MTSRQQLRARYPAILERASLSYGPGWDGLMEALCGAVSENGKNRTLSRLQRS